MCYLVYVLTYSILSDLSALEVSGRRTRIEDAYDPRDASITAYDSTLDRVPPAPRLDFMQENRNGILRAFSILPDGVAGEGCGVSSYPTMNSRFGESGDRESTSTASNSQYTVTFYSIILLNPSFLDHSAPYWTLRTGERELRLQTLRPGSGYTVHIRSDVHSAALFGLPLSFTVPPRPPKITRESWPMPDHIRIEWSKSSGATHFCLEFWVSQDLKRQEMVTETYWSGVLGTYRPTHIKVYSVASDNTMSAYPEEWKVKGLPAKQNKSLNKKSSSDKPSSRPPESFPISNTGHDTYVSDFVTFCSRFMF